SVFAFAAISSGTPVPTTLKCTVNVRTRIVQIWGWGLAVRAGRAVVAVVVTAVASGTTRAAVATGTAEEATGTAVAAIAPVTAGADAVGSVSVAARATGTTVIAATAIPAVAAVTT